MPETAKLLVSSKIINKVAKCTMAEAANPLLSQIHIIRYKQMVMLAGLNGFALVMRKVKYDDEGMSPSEIDQADRNYNAALATMAWSMWMFPADLKIPNGLNTTITLYDDDTTVLQTKNAIYGPFGKVPQLSGAEFIIHQVYQYPAHSTGSCRALGIGGLSRLVSAMGEKKDTLILNITGDAEKPMYIRTADGEAYGMILPIKGILDDVLTTDLT